MSRGLFLFGLWCLVNLAGSVASAYYAWSPFSDEDRSGGYGGTRGPSHK